MWSFIFHYLNLVLLLFSSQHYIVDRVDYKDFPLLQIQSFTDKDFHPLESRIWIYDRVLMNDIYLSCLQVPLSFSNRWFRKNFFTVSSWTNCFRILPFDHWIEIIALMLIYTIMVKCSKVILFVIEVN